MFLLYKEVTANLRRCIQYRNKPAKGNLRITDSWLTSTGGLAYKRVSKHPL